jgi:hypothetical protein
MRVHNLLGKTIMTFLKKLLAFTLSPIMWLHARLWQFSLVQNFPDLASFRTMLAAKNPGQDWEVLKQSLYDFQIYPTAGNAALNFFQVAIGGANSASSGNATNPKVLGDTNMTQAGILPAPMMFFCNSVEVHADPGSVATANTFTIQTAASSVAAPAAATGAVQVGAVNDVNAILTGGALTFTIGQKVYLQEGPLFRFPPKCRFELDAAVTSNSATTAEVAFAKLKAGGRPYQLDPGIAIFSMQNFAVQLIWPVVIATPSGFNARVGVVLDGWLFRAVQ